MNWFKLLGVVVAAGASVAVGACSSSSDNNSSDGGTTGGDGGTTADGGGGGDGGTTSGAPYSGQILLAVTKGKAAGSASFQKASADTVHCQTSESGPCHVTICPDSQGDEDGGAPLSAGTITIAGGSAPLKLELSDVSAVYQSSQTDVTFTAGATATVSATGGDVPAFDGKTAKVPADITVGTDYATIDYTKDMTVTWTGGTDGKVGVTLVAADTSIATIACTFDASAGTGTIPKAAFASFPKCDDASTAICTYSIGPIATTQFTAGDYGITFTATGNGKIGTYTTP